MTADAFGALTWRASWRLRPCAYTRTTGSVSKVAVPDPSESSWNLRQPHHHTPGLTGEHAVVRPTSVVPLSWPGTSKPRTRAGSLAFELANSRRTYSTIATYDGARSGSIKVRFDSAAVTGLATCLGSSPDGPNTYPSFQARRSSIR